MKNKLIVLILCLLTVVLSYSQTSYPQSLIINKDTFIVITKSQLTKINKDYIKFSLCDSLSSLKDINIALLEANQDDLLLLSNNKDSLIVSKDNIISIQKDDIKQLTKEYKILYRKNKVNKVKIWISSIFTGLGCGSLGIVLGTLVK